MGFGSRLGLNGLWAVGKAAKRRIIATRRVRYVESPFLVVIALCRSLRNQSSNTAALIPPRYNMDSETQIPPSDLHFDGNRLSLLGRTRLMRLGLRLPAFGFRLCLAPSKAERHPEESRWWTPKSWTMDLGWLVLGSLILFILRERWL